MHHKLTEIDEVNKQAVCSTCGPTDIYIVDNGTRKRRECNTNLRQQRSKYKRKVKYNLTPEALKSMLEDQKYRCLLCEKNFWDEKENKFSFVVDHDHSCCPTHMTCGNCVRGLLCVGCNILLGRLENTEAESLKEFLDRLTAYLT